MTAAGINQSDFFNGEKMGKAKKGTRWRECDEVPADWKIQAAEKLKKTRFNPVDLNVEAMKFENYWCSVSGQKGIKTNWFRTWLNWTLSAAERAGYREKPNAAADITGHRTKYNADDYGLGPRR